MNADDPTIRPAGEQEGDVGFPQVDTDLFHRLASLRAEDPGIHLEDEGGTAPEPPPLSGPSQRYSLKGELGRGGMGVVYRVFDAELQRNLAMKVLRVGTAGSSQTPEAAGRQVVRRFLEEAQVTGQLDHPGIVPLHELGVDSEGRMYFTMRVVRGEDLGRIVQRMRSGEGDWDLPRVVSSLLRVCDAMAFAHAKSVVHRDLKPSNIMAGQFGEVYVMDWGLARVLGREDSRDLRPDVQASREYTVVQTEGGESDDGVVTLDGTVCGTPAYMAPEQALGQVDRIDQRADVYSLGAILYHVLTGYPPYVPGDARIAGHIILRWVTEGPPKPARELASDAPRELAAICDKAMAREPQDRYPSMRAMKEDLLRFLRGQPVEALQLGPFERALRWGRRNAVAMGLVVAVLLACGAGLSIMNSLSTALVRQTARDGAVMQARILEEVNSLYTSEIVSRLRGEVDVTHAYRDQEHAIPLPATFLTTLADRITGDDSSVGVRHYSDHPFAFREDGGAKDEFEEEALARLRADPSRPIFRWEEVDGQPVVRFASARILQAGCVDCHNTHPDSTKRDWKAGDVRGVLAIQQPLDHQRSRVQQGLRTTFLAVGGIAAALLAVVVWGVLRIRSAGPVA